jgi:predicted RNA binding protein YcfA (HicA-like mRNA interferase family)
VLDLVDSLVRARDVIRKIEQSKRCRLVRQRGSHKLFECRSGETVCRTTVPDHGSHDLGTALLHAIEKDLEPCLGKGWLTK